MPTAASIEHWQGVLREVLLHGAAPGEALRPAHRPTGALNFWAQRAPETEPDLGGVARDLTELQGYIGHLRTTGRLCPVARFGDRFVPILGPYATPPDDEVPLDRIPVLMAEPLAAFVGAALTVGGTGTFTVEVSNNASGWQVIYSAAYLAQRNGFGGPSTPVSATIQRGLWRFGIAQGATEQWDPTHWAVPANLKIYLPLP